MAYRGYFMEGRLVCDYFALADLGVTLLVWWVVNETTYLLPTMPLWRSITRNLKSQHNMVANQMPLPVVMSRSTVHECLGWYSKRKVLWKKPARMKLYVCTGQSIWKHSLATYPFGNLLLSNIVIRATIPLWTQILCLARNIARPAGVSNVKRLTLALQCSVVPPISTFQMKCTLTPVRLIWQRAILRDECDSAWIWIRV